MHEDDPLQVSVGSSHSCFLWAHEPITMAAHGEFVLANFSGVLCIDAVHDSGRTILFATAPLGDLTVSFTLVETNDQDHMNAFLQALKNRGLNVQVAITDGSPLYKDSLQRYWTDIEGCHHQTREPTSTILCCPQPRLRVAGAALHRLLKTMHTAFGKPCLLGTLSNTLCGVLPKTLGHPKAFVPKSHVGLFSEG